MKNESNSVHRYYGDNGGNAKSPRFFQLYMGHDDDVVSFFFFFFFSLFQSIILPFSLILCNALLICTFVTSDNQFTRASLEQRIRCLHVDRRHLAAWVEANRHHHSELRVR